ncbi:MAG: RodZ domain-containing protein [Pseudomonadota bacterium]
MSRQPQLNLNEIFEGDEARSDDDGRSLSPADDLNADAMDLDRGESEPAEEGDAFALDDGPGYEGVGAELRAHRIRQNHDVATIAEALRIKSMHVEALEDGRHNAMPGKTYAMGFVRSYAEFLGLEADEYLRRFKAELTVRTAQDNALLAGLSDLQTDESRTAGWLIGLCFTVFVALGVIWAVSNASRQTALTEFDVATIPPVTDSLRQAAEPTVENTIPAVDAVEAAFAGRDNPAPGPAGDTALSPDEAEAETQVTDEATMLGAGAAEEYVMPLPIPPAGQPVLIAPRPKPADLEDVLALGEATDAVGVVPSFSPSVQVETAEPPVDVTVPQGPPLDVFAWKTLYGAYQTNSRMTVRAWEPVFVRVERRSDGTILMNRTLEAGDAFRLPREEGLLLITPNAGALEMVVDGQPTGRIAGPGDALKGLELVPETFLDRLADLARREG